jgi:hypothetical protein
VITFVHQGEVPGKLYPRGLTIEHKKNFVVDLFNVLCVLWKYGPHADCYLRGASNEQQERGASKTHHLFLYGHLPGLPYIDSTCLMTA